MLNLQEDPIIVLDSGGSTGVKAVAFHSDGIHLLGGGDGGIQRWRLEVGQEVGKQTQMHMVLNAISMSRDHSWIVCGTGNGASIWDAEMQEKVIQVDMKTAMTVDVSPDSTRFATGSGVPHNEASIWSITGRERLVGPLKHDSYVTAVRFSPNGERIATSCRQGSIRIFDSRNGDELITIKVDTPSIWPCTPLAWSNDGLRIFAASRDNRIKSFDVSTGSQLAESPTLNVNPDDYVKSIVLAANGRFIATFANRTISFLETSTLTRIDPVIEDSAWIYSIAISPDSGYLATGRNDGKITIRDLGIILPDVYGPFHVSICPSTLLAFQTCLVPSPTLTYYVRHLIARRHNQTSNLQLRAAMTTNHRTHPRYEFAI